MSRLRGPRFPSSRRVFTLRSFFVEWQLSPAKCVLFAHQSSVDAKYISRPLLSHFLELPLYYILGPNNQRLQKPCFEKVWRFMICLWWNRNIITYVAFSITGLTTRWPGFIDLLYRSDILAITVTRSFCITAFSGSHCTWFHHLTWEWVSEHSREPWMKLQLIKMLDLAFTENVGTKSAFPAKSVKKCVCFCVCVCQSDRPH